MAHEGSRQIRDRAVTRSKAEKTRPPTVPVPQVEIVPGRLTEAEWIALQAVEEGEEVVGDIMADLLARVLDSAFKVYLSHQCIPFTISQAREAMLQITEWRFLARDEGESSVAEDPTWGEDEEPSACTTDSWAQGSVPVLHAPVLGRAEETRMEDRVKKTPVGRAWTAGTLSSRLRDSPGLPPTSEPVQEAGPEGSSVDQVLAPASGSLSPDIQSSLEVAYNDSSHSSLDRLEETSSRYLSETPEALGPRPSLEDWYRCLGSPDGSGDWLQIQKADMARTYENELSSPCVEGPIRSSREAMWPEPPRSWSSRSRRSSALSRGPPKATTERLYTAQVASRWVRPQVKVLGPRYEAHPLEAHSSWLHREKTEDFCASPRILVPFPPGERFRAQTSSPRPQLRPLNLRLPCFSLESGVPSSGLGILAAHQAVPKKVHSSSSKVWPRANWPIGWEAAAELLDQMWAGGHHPHVLPKGPGPEEKAAPDVLVWPHPEPQMLKSTSQVLWTPMLAPEALTLAPGVSLWNPATQKLLTAQESQLESRESQAFPGEQRPIQTAAPKPLTTAAQLTRNSAPRVFSVPIKPPSPSTP